MRIDWVRFIVAVRPGWPPPSGRLLIDRSKDTLHLQHVANVPKLHVGEVRRQDDNLLDTFRIVVWLKLNATSSGLW